MSTSGLAGFVPVEKCAGYQVLPAGRLTDGRRLRGGQTTEARRMCGVSAAEARRQCDGRAMDGRPVRPSRVCLLASVVCPSRARRPSVIRPKEGLFRPYDGWTAAAGRTDDGCATVARPPRLRRASVVCPPRRRRPSVIRPK